MGGPRRPPPPIRPAQPHHRAPPLRPPLRARLFRARAAPRLVPPPPAVRVRARRCGFFSGLRGAPLLAPALAGTRLFRGLPSARRRPAAKTRGAVSPVSSPSCPPLSESAPKLRRPCRPTPEPRGGGGDVPVPGTGSLSPGARPSYPPACKPLTPPPPGPGRFPGSLHRFLRRSPGS